MNLKAIKSRFTKAFSLIELMVVIAIVALLTAIAVPSYQSYLQQSKVTEIFSLASDQMNQWAQKYNTSSTTNTYSNTALGTYITNTQYTFGTGSTPAVTSPFTSTNCPLTGNGASGALGAVCIYLGSNAGNIDSSLNGATLIFTPVPTSSAGDTSDISLQWTCNYHTSAGGQNTTTDTLLSPGNCTHYN